MWWGPFESPSALITALSEAFTCIVLALLTRNLYLRLKQRQHPATKYLTLTTFFLSLTAGLQLTDIFIFGPFTTFQSVGYSFAFAMSAVGNIFMLWFLLEIFSSGRKSGGAKANVFVGVESAVVVLVSIFGPTWLFGFTLQNVFLAILVVHLIFALILYFTLIRVTTQAIAKASDPIARRGFSYIRAGGFTIAVAYISFILDRVWFFAFGISYSPWVITGWFLAALSGILLFFGFVWPTRARKQGTDSNQ
ncbi:MAG TPA: hypothetical protein VKK79_03680 [Candidatus Lokiarchaeia archaeon]|nr:hypothetical protein [Candidatus Lokiarchaeia archaeon]